MNLLGWAFKLHVMKWSRYREDVIVWMIAIWLTIGMQACFLYVTYNALEGNFFGYTFHEVIGFLGLILFATGLAQCFVHGVILHLARVVWSGQFDYWIIQPAPLFLRMLLEDLGFMWFWPHLIVGLGIMWWAFPGAFLYAILLGILAAVLEGALIMCLCVPSIKWGKWDPNEGIWEYLEGSRSIPLGRVKSKTLLLASFGVLQYSIALDIMTGTLPLWLLPLSALTMCVLAWFMMQLLVRSYSSASS